MAITTNNVKPITEEEWNRIVQNANKRDKKRQIKKIEEETKRKKQLIDKYGVSKKYPLKKQRNSSSKIKRKTKYIEIKREEKIKIPAYNGTRRKSIERDVRPGGRYRKRKKRNRKK